MNGAEISGVELGAIEGRAQLGALGYRGSVSFRRRRVSH